MAYTSPPPMAEPLLKEKPFGGRILQHMKSVTFPPHPSRCGSAPSTFQEKPLGECICQLSTPAMPDFSTQPSPPWQRTAQLDARAGEARPKGKYSRGRMALAPIRARRIFPATGAGRQCRLPVLLTWLFRHTQVLWYFLDSRKYRNPRFSPRFPAPKRARTHQRRAQ